MAQEQNTKTPPLVDLKVTNPVEYIKLWWKKVIGNEGVDFRLHFHPLTALLIALVIAGAFFGLGVKFEEKPKEPTPSSTPSPSDWKETAFTGTLQYSKATSKYFLTTTSASEAITLKVPEAIDLADLVGKRILVIGSYNKADRLFIVRSATQKIWKSFLKLLRPCQPLAQHHRQLQLNLHLQAQQTRLC